MAVKVGINGFGRIGRNFLRAARKARAEAKRQRIEARRQRIEAARLRKAARRAALFGRLAADGDVHVLTRPVTAICRCGGSARQPWS